VSDLNNDYCQCNAGMFFADTVDVDITPLYRRPAGGAVVGAGRVAAAGLVVVGVALLAQFGRSPCLSGRGAAGFTAVLPVRG
jgi:hypothetical protein